MRITLKKHGGQLPMMQQPAKSIDVDKLDEPARADLHRLLNSAQEQQSKSAAPTQAAPDGMSYTFTIDGAGEDKQSVIRGSDGRLSRPFAELLEWWDRYSKSS